MAEYAVAAGNSLAWNRSGTAFLRRRITKVDDGNDSNLEFTVNESVTATQGSGTTFQAVYRGTIEWPDGSGEKYPVVQSTGTGNYYMVGYTPDSLDSVSLEDRTTIRNSITAETFTVCFFPGTLIATPSGERKVEELDIGDLVSVGDSGDVVGRKFVRAVSVKWIGRQTVSTLFGPADRLMPVRFAAGSLQGGLLPHSNLTITADHAMLVDGVLCEAGALVNGTTITRVPLSGFGESYTVYHVETEAHEIILANGAPAETFIDNVSRRAFDNYFEFEELYGDPPEMRELTYPRASNARHLPSRIKARLGIGTRKVSVA